MSIADTPDSLSIVLRAMSFTLLLNAAGIPVFMAAFGRLMPASLPAVRRLGWRLAVGALLAVAAHHALEAARMSGEMRGMLDPAMQKSALQSREGAAFVVRMLGLLLVAAGLRWSARVPPPVRAVLSDVGVGSWRVGLPVLSLLGTSLTIASFSLVGHTSVTPHRPEAAMLLTVHLLVVAFWLGALWPLYLAAAKEQPAVAARVIEAFSLAAAWVVPLILLAGIGLTMALVPSLAAFRQPYGQLLLTKVGLFSVLMALASLNKWTFGPACAAGDATAFEWTVICEYVLICLVLAVTAGMTTFYSPAAA